MNVKIYCEMIENEFEFHILCKIFMRKSKKYYRKNGIFEKKSLKKFVLMYVFAKAIFDIFYMTFV